MRPTRGREEELRLETELKIKYKSTACIRLERLHFRWNEPRELGVKNVERLKSNFRKDCRRLAANCGLERMKIAPRDIQGNDGIMNGVCAEVVSIRFEINEHVEIRFAMWLLNWDISSTM